MRPARLRPQHWPEALAELVEARRHTPFAWGSMDCVSFAAEATAAVAGIDPLAALRGTYATEAEAEAIIAAEGNLFRLVSRLWAEAGFEPCPPALAQRGDAAWVEAQNTQAMGVVLGTAVAVPGPDGLSFHPLGAMLRAWSC